MFELHQVNDTHHVREEDDEMEEEGEDMVSDIIFMYMYVSVAVHVRMLIQSEVMIVLLLNIY